MADVLRVKPRETRVFENEQRSRFSPDAVVSTITNGGLGGTLTFSPDSTEFIDGAITLVDNVGSPYAALPVIDAQAIVTGTYTLDNDGVVNPIAQLAVLLTDTDSSITAYQVTVNGTDAADSPISDVLNFTGGGVLYTSNGPYKTVTSVTATAPTGANGGETLTIKARNGTAAHDKIRSHTGLFSNAVVQDDPQSGVNDDNGAYLTSNTQTGDLEVRLGMPTLPSNVVAVETLTIEWHTKNVGTPSNGGIQYLLRHSGTNYILGANTTADTDASAGVAASVQLTLAPGTGEAWTLAQVNSLELGVIFKGDSPAIEKRFMRVRMEATVRTVAEGVTAMDAEQGILEALSGNPFDEGATDDGKFVRFYGVAASRLSCTFPSLPAEAIGVNEVKSFYRITYANQGHANGAAENTYPCALGGSSGSAVASVQPRGGYGQHTGRGPLEQSNAGGIRPMMNSPQGGVEFFGDEGNGRILVGPGNPSDGCGFGPGAMSGRNLAWGTFLNHSETLTVTPSLGNPWTVAAADGVEVGIDAGDLRGEYHVSKLYADIEWLRQPNGSPYLHIVLDDDLDNPDDTDFFESQHPSNKKVGCDFNKIPEVTGIGYVTAYVRGRKNPGAGQGWRTIWRLGDDAGSDVVEATETNDSFETKAYTRPLSPFTGLAWTREEVNNLVIIWEAIGENAYHGKRVSLMELEIGFDAIPDKIDAARNILSLKTRFLRKPRPFLTVELPPLFANLELVDDLSVIHNAIPRTSKTLGFDRWDWSLMRVFKEVIKHNRDTIELTLFDLREFLTTLWIAGRSRTQGASVDGMAILTPGVSVVFVRETNDYFEDRFAQLVEELGADTPPVGLEGILIQNGAVQRVVNSAFSEGATDVFDGWTKQIGTGGSIVEDTTDVAFSENVVNGPKRSVLMTGATTPSDGVWLERLVSLPHGDGLSPEGAVYAGSVHHKDDSGAPVSVSVEVDPPGFAARQYSWGDVTWVQQATPIWLTLPVASVRRRDPIPIPLYNLDDIPFTGGGTDFDALVRVGVRSVSAQVNHLYSVQWEGGTIQAAEDQQYATTFILAKTGPTVRDTLKVGVPNFRTRPCYPAEGRGTFLCQVVPLWDSWQLPLRTGVRRYIYSLVLNPSNHDVLYYDADTESFVFERKVAGTTAQATFYYPEVVKDEPIEIATRWISSLGDLDETPFAITIFVNGEQGTTSTTLSQAPALPTESELVLLSLDGQLGTAFDGYTRNLEIRQLAMTQAAIARVYQ